MPNVRASSGTMGTIFLPISLSLRSWVSIWTNTMVVETSRSTPSKKRPQTSFPSGMASGSLRTRRAGTGPPRTRRRSRMYWISGLLSGGQ